DAALELLCDRFGNQRSIEFGLADFDDVDDDVGGRDVGHLLAQLVDVGALLADHDARTRRVDRDAALLVRTFDHDARHRGLLQFLVQDLADLDVLVQQLAVFGLAGEPARIPGPVDAETQADRIDLLTHLILLAPLYALASTSRTTIVSCENGLNTRPERPRPRGAKRFITRPLPTKASETTSSSTSRSWLFSALAMADSRHFLTSTAIRLRENCRSASAAEAFLPRISCATRLSFCGLTRSIRATALASLSGRLRSRLGLLIARSSSLLGFLVARMAVEGPGRRKLAELVADHFLVDRNRHVLLAVVDAEHQTDELRQDGRAAAPDLDHVVTARRARGIRLLQKRAFDERAFPD